MRDRCVGAIDGEVKYFVFVIWSVLGLRPHETNNFSDEVPKLSQILEKDIQLARDYVCDWLMTYDSSGVMETVLMLVGYVEGDGFDVECDSLDCGRTFGILCVLRRALHVLSRSIAYVSYVGIVERKQHCTILFFVK